MARASEVFAERWTPLILRELFDGAHRFSEIHAGVPRMSRSLLAQRLRSLEQDHIIERHQAPGERGARYYLTPAGLEFRDVVELLGAWGRRWMADVHTDDLDPHLLMAAMARRVRRELVPAHRVVFEFVFRVPAAHCWLVIDPEGAEACIEDPGYPSDLVVTADSGALAQVHLGYVALADGVRDGGIELDGPRWAAHGLEEWIGLSATAAWERKWTPALEAAGRAAG